MENRNQNTEVNQKGNLKMNGLSATIYQLISNSYLKSVRAYQIKKYQDATPYVSKESLYNIFPEKRNPEIQNMWNFAGILMNDIWEYPETVPYQERLVALPFDIVQNLDEKTRNDVVNLYRKASSPYGLRVRACDDCYFIYWDEIQLANTPLEELGINYYQLMVQNKGNKEKVNKTLEKILRK